MAVRDQEIRAIEMRLRSDDPEFVAEFEALGGKCRSNPRMRWTKLGLVAATWIAFALAIIAAVTSMPVFAIAAVVFGIGAACCAFARRVPMTAFKPSRDIE